MFKHGIRLIATALVATFIGTAAHAYTATTTGNLNVRTGPGVGYSKVGVLPRGAVVDVRECRQRWCEVNFHGRWAWASASYLSVTTATVRRAPSRYVHVYPGLAYPRSSFFGWGYPRRYWGRPGATIYFGGGWGGGFGW